jgi:hypothetical protein
VILDLFDVIVNPADSPCVVPPTPQRPRIQTFKDAAVIEPRLLDLENRVRSGAFGSGDWAYEAWKGWLQSLVGWDCKRRELSTCEAYGVCHSHLLRLFETRRKSAVHKRRAINPGSNGRPTR